MKAVVWTNYGAPEVLELQEIEKPTPKDNEVRIKIHATAVTAGDCEMRNLKFPALIRVPMQLYVGLQKPTRVKILGAYFAGEIEAVGKNVTRFRVGDAVFGTSGFQFSAYAEYICLPENSADTVLITKPSNMSFVQAAPVPLGGLEALHFLRNANLQHGQKILINGAGGTIGTYTVQLAKNFGAYVTAVDSTEKLDMLRALGADEVIDYTQNDFSRDGKQYDVIFDVVLNSSFSKMFDALTKDGIYLMTNPTLPKMLRGAWASRSSRKKVFFATTTPNVQDLTRLQEWIEAGKLTTVIDRVYPMEQIVEAHRYIEAGHKKGNVVLAIV